MTRLTAGLAGLLVAVLAGCATPRPATRVPAASSGTSGPGGAAASTAASPVPAPVVTPAPAPSDGGGPAKPAIDAGWRTIATAATLGPTHLRDVALFRGSLVAVGDGDDRVGRIWASPDGRKWSSVAGGLPLRGAVLRSVAVGDAGIVAVGWSEDDAVAVVSPDGLRWERVTLPGSHPGSSAVSVAWHGGRYVAVGGGGESNAAVSWSSTDGRTWSVLAIVEEGQAESLSSVAAGPAGFVASGGHGPRGAIWTSSDGAAWSRIDLPSSTSDDQGRLRYLDGTWFLLGAGGVVWLSADGRAWTRTVVAGFGVGVFDVATTPVGVVAVGRSSTEPGEPGVVALARPTLAAWTAAPPDPVFSDGLASSIVMAPDGRTLVGVGMNRQGESVFVLADVRDLLDGASGLSLAIGDLHVVTAADRTTVEQIRMRVTVSSLLDVRIDRGGKSAWPRFSVQEAGNHALVDVEASGPAGFGAGSATPFDLTFDVAAMAAAPGGIVFASTSEPSTIGDWVLRMLLVDDAGREVDVRLPFTIGGPS